MLGVRKKENFDEEIAVEHSNSKSDWSPCRFFNQLESAAHGRNIQRATAPTSHPLNRAFLIHPSLDLSLQTRHPTPTNLTQSQLLKKDISPSTPPPASHTHTDPTTCPQTTTPLSAAPRAETPAPHTISQPPHSTQSKKAQCDEGRRSESPS